MDNAKMKAELKKLKRLYMNEWSEKRDISNASQRRRHGSSWHLKYLLIFN